METEKKIITYKVIGTSFGVYYLFYLNGKFVESCDESELEEVKAKLESDFSKSPHL